MRGSPEHRRSDPRSEDGFYRSANQGSRLMYSFSFERAGDSASALRAFGPGASDLAGGTTLLDLMKLEVMRPEVVIDVDALRKTHADISMREGTLRLGAFVRMADAEAHPLVLEHLPMLAQTLQLAASPQLRNMATQGTRSPNCAAGATTISSRRGA
jgi:CO/xanthine dehydrogenase FAD-binding subunit